MVVKGSPSGSSKGADWAAISNAAKRAPLVVVSFLFFPPFFYFRSQGNAAQE